MNTNLTLVNGKMNTLQFAELTDTKHKNVLAKARKLLNDLGIDSAEFSAQYDDPSGKSNTMLVLDKNLSLTLAGQYEPKIAYHVTKFFNNNVNRVPPKQPISPLAQAHKTLTVVTEALELETTKRENAEHMLQTATRIQSAALDAKATLTVDEFCKIIGSKLDNVNMGRTTCYIILRSIGIVEKTSTRPTQRGMTIYLDYKPEGEYGYSTRVHSDKCNQLIKLMIRHMRDNPTLNDVLGNPLGDI